MTASIRKRLRAANAERRMVEIIRSLPDAEGMEGTPLALGRKLLLLYVVNPDLLLPDGFSVVRVEDVTEVRHSDWDQVVGRALADESRLRDASATPDVRLGRWAQLDRVPRAHAPAQGQPVHRCLYPLRRRSSVRMNGGCSRFRVAEAPVPGTPRTVWPPSPRRRTSCSRCGEFIRSGGTTARP